MARQVEHAFSAAQRAREEERVMIQLPLEALQDFVNYAAGLKLTVEEQLCTSAEEYEGSEAEWARHLEALGIVVGDGP